MRIALVSVFALILGLAGYCIAFQQAEPTLLNNRARAEPLRAATPQSARSFPAYEAPGATGFASNRYLPASAAEPILEAASQQIALIISKSGLRVLSTRTANDIDDIELPPDGLLVICNSADIKHDAEGQPEVICQAAAVIKSASFNGKAGVLRHKSGKIVLESGESDSFIARNKGNTTVFMLRAKKINVDLNTLQIEGSDGSVVQLKNEPTPEPAVNPEPGPV